MIEGLLDKDTTLDLATRVSTAPAKPRGARISVDPRVWLGALALRGSVVAENKTPEAEQTAKDRKSYIPRDLALSYLQARQEERTATGVRFAERAGLAHGFDYHFVTAFLAELTTHLIRRVRFTIPREGSENHTAGFGGTDRHRGRLGHRHGSCARRRRPDARPDPERG
jgi:hypothetical protein